MEILAEMNGMWLWLIVMFFLLLWLWLHLFKLVIDAQSANCHLRIRIDELEKRINDACAADVAHCRACPDFATCHCVPEFLKEEGKSECNT